MSEFKGQYDFSKKLKWNPAYIEQPGTGPEATSCQSCISFGHDVDKGEYFGGNDKHFYFCNLVLESAGVCKAINKETASCSRFEKRERGVKPHTTDKK